MEVGLKALNKTCAMNKQWWKNEHVADDDVGVEKSPKDEKPP